MRSLVAFLRSRNVAVVLLVGLTLYLWVSTAVPLESVDPVAAAVWQEQNPQVAAVARLLGLTRAFSSPFFLIAACWLTLSTAVCAWERSQRSLRAWRSRGIVTQSVLYGLENSSTLTCTAPPESSTEDTLNAVARALEAKRMKVRRGPRVVYGSSGAFGPIGSPLFHWALVGLFVIAGLGQLLLYEGFANVLVGEPIVDSPSAYGLGFARGPLAPESLTGLQIEVVEVRADLVADGVQRGTTPLVRLVRNGSVVAEDWVYPNNPLRYGGLTVHQRQAGPALVGTVASLSTDQTEQVRLYFEEVGASSAQSFDVLDPSTLETLTVSVAPSPGQRVAISAATAAGGSLASTQTVAVGEPAKISDALTFTPDQLTGYAQLKVVNDRTLTAVFAMFFLGTLGVALAMFVPARQVYVDATPALGGGDPSAQLVRLRVLATTAKSDPAFPRRIAEAVRSAVHCDLDDTPFDERRPT